jgi:hypothetical protein
MRFPSSVNARAASGRQRMAMMMPMIERCISSLFLIVLVFLHGVVDPPSREKTITRLLQPVSGF